MLLLKQRQFGRYWLSRMTGAMANQMLMVAVSWQMYDLTGSALDLGLVGLIQFLPALVLTLPAGHLADRARRNRIISACLVVQCTAAAILVFATHGTVVSRNLIFALALALGVARAFQTPAQQAIVPLLVESRLLSLAITTSASGMQAAIICGPALGGMIYGFGPMWVYIACSALLLLASMLMATVRAVHCPVKGGLSRREIFAGVTFLRGNQVLLGALSLDLFAVLLGGATALLPIYARDILRSGPLALGLLRAAPAVGALMMSLALLRWPLQRHVGKRFLQAVGLFGLATVCFGLSRHMTLSLLALAVTGASDNLSVVVRQSLVQFEAPNEIRGRVSAVNSIFIGASNQLGEFESGATAALIGPVGSVVLGGIGTFALAVLWSRLFPSLRTREVLEGPSTGGLSPASGRAAQSLR
jgi:MFS family permease